MELLKDNMVIEFIINFLHLLAALIWLGGLFFFLIIMPRGIKGSQFHLEELQPLIFDKARSYIWFAIVALLITGGMKIQHGIFHTMNLYSVTLMVKIGLYVLMTLLALYVTLRLFPQIKAEAALPNKPSESLEKKKKLMKILASTVLLLGLCVIGCVAILHM